MENVVPLFLIKPSNRTNVTLSIKLFYEIKCSNLSIDPEMFLYQTNCCFQCKQNLNDAYKSMLKHP